MDADQDGRGGDVWALETMAVRSLSAVPPGRVMEVTVMLPLTDYRRSRKRFGHGWRLQFSLLAMQPSSLFAQSRRRRPGGAADWAHAVAPCPSLP